MAYEISDHGLGRDTMTNAKAKKPEAEALGGGRVVRMRRRAVGLLEEPVRATGTGCHCGPRAPAPVAVTCRR